MMRKFVDTYVLVAVGVADATCGSFFDAYFLVAVGVVDVFTGHQERLFLRAAWAKQV